MFYHDISFLFEVPSYAGCDWPSILIMCVDLLIRYADLSETCCTHWVGVFAESLCNFRTRLT